ncbi:uncharacterized protein [Maniola hyperantus]|uniref:uncharacterized protein n=1 Tax=Aphantopus hyperantus TaxID=2795564 RepID=UPI003747B17A
MKTLFYVSLLVVATCAHSHNHNHHHDHDHNHDHNHHNHNHGGAESQQPVVVSPSGEFRGSYNTTRRGRQFESYRGIYYAEPPVGELRFQPPKLILEYKTPVDASEDGPACPLLVGSDYFIDENCLTINVYTPLKKDRSKPLPVIFFIHPGGFYSMTGRSDLFGGQYLLDRDVVLVTINYRIGSLGFLSTGDELAPGNNGYKDQVAALKWVQRNIAAFGGDPNSVTIAGCSAGSISVMLHMISPMSKGLFHRGISMSGSPVYKGPTPDNLYHLAVRQAEILNCPTNNSKVIIDCLKTKPWRDIGSSLPGFYEFGFDPVGIWMPIIEKDFGQERFLPIDPIDAIREGKMHAVPHIISQTEDEFFWFAFAVLKNKTLSDQMNAEWERIAPISFMMDRRNATYAARRLRTAYLHDKPLKNDAESAKNLGLLYQDSIESFPVHRMANLMCRHSPHPVWYYKFSYVGNHSFYEDPVTTKPVAAAHHDDLVYLFPLSFQFPGISTEGLDSVLVERMTGIWYNFARHGNPNPRGDPSGDIPELEGLNWPAMKPDDRKYLRIGDDLSIHKNMKEERIQLWEELYPIEYVGIEPQQPVVVSLSGEFRGGYNVTRRGRRFETYRGIRYAEPPVGNLRFQPPVLILNYESPVDASEDSPACPQPTKPGYNVNEDCLTINVYTPLKNNRSKPLPVIFYIHGGGFYSLSGRSDKAGPHYLLDRDIVLVTINYRLGSLGFLSTGDELAPGNNGLKDQVAALKWVQRNIAGFGGDPNSVTITGCSVGSKSVMLHMISPMSKGLFHRSISMSGSPLYAMPSPDNLYYLAVKQARLLNCSITDNSRAIIDCLKRKTWRELGDSLKGFNEFAHNPIVIWSPVVERDYGQERFLTMQPLDAIREGKMHAVPYIISQTTDEFFWKAFTILGNKTWTEQMNAEWDRIAPITFIMPRENSSRATQKLFSVYLNNQPIRNDTESAKNLGLLFQDGVESFPIHRMANLMCRHSPYPVWYYEFNYIGTHSHYEDPVTKKPVGVAHHDDLIYLFSMSAFPAISTEGRDATLVDRMTGIWYNFARYGDPNPRGAGNLPELEGLQWPAMKPDDRKYLRIADDLTVHVNLKEDRIKVWEELYPIQY